MFKVFSAGYIIYTTNCTYLQKSASNPNRSLHTVEEKELIDGTAQFAVKVSVNENRCKKVDLILMATNEVIPTGFESENPNR